MKEITIIDTFGFFFRSYYALPPLKSKNGFPTGLLTGFANFINQLAKEHSSDYLLFALDSEGPSFRKDIDRNYKAQRPQTPPDLLKQLEVAIEWIDKMGLSRLRLEGYEADDIIASIAECAKKKGVKVTIVTHDKDLYQLIEDERVVIYDPIKRVKIDERGAFEKFGVKPSQIADFLALTGDSSDNIPGVKGIGAKSAAKLLERFETLENIYENIESVEPQRVKKLLAEGKESAFLSRKLVELKKDLFKECDLEPFRFPEKNPLLKIADELIEYDMNAVLKRLKNGDFYAVPKKERVDFEYEIVTDYQRARELLENMRDKPVAFDIETDSLDTREASLVGFSFCFEEAKAYYVPVGHKYLGVPSQFDSHLAIGFIEEIFQNRVFGHNLKFDLSVLYAIGLKEQKIYADTMIMAWLVDPQSSLSLDSLAKRYFAHSMISFKETVKKGENFSSVPIEEAAKYAAEDAYLTYMLYFALKDELKGRSKTLLEEAEEVEYPFVNTLIWMERSGIRVDIEFLKELGRKTDEKLAELTSRIYELAGGEFNINSTKQLAEVLFERLKLPPVKRTKTGFSTNETVLSLLAQKHPIAKEILEYRELFKLKSTYIEPLTGYAQKDPRSRVYTTFVQTGTATGRLSSKNPNLQNIPVRTELGREIRAAFVAPEGKVLIGIDYSQIELRLLAHFSKDEALREAFVKGEDIHLRTAVKLFGEEAEKKRNVAKSINFGLIYGMGSRKLSQTLGISQKEAKRIIDSYFASFPTVKEFLSSIESKVREKGYVETLLGRRRYFDFEHAGAAQIAANIREATNTVFQGSAADLIKLAMNKIKKSVQNDSLPVNMVLQIHDELIFEADAETADELSKRFASIMEGIYPLEVPLVCSVSIAKRWSELK